MSTATSEIPLARTSRIALPGSVAFFGLAALLAAFFLAAGAPTPLLVIYQQEWGFAPWLLTLAFGAYAIGLLVAVLVFGSLSDYVGRKPLLTGAVAVELVSVLMFFAARDVEWIIAARVVQGFATGAAASAFTAAVVELAPEHRKRLGTTLGSAAPAAGLGLGALFSGLVAQFSTQAAAVVWGVLAIVMALGLVLTLLVRETVSSRPGALRSLIPRVTVPTHARSTFGKTAPILIAAWLMAALFMGLAPTILAHLFGLHSAALNGAVTFTSPAIAAIVSVAMVRVPARRTLILGGIAVVFGATTVATGILLVALPVFWVGGAIGGAGFGAVLSGTFRALTPLVQPHQRAGLFAAIYLTAYLAFGVPAIIAGLLVLPLGLESVVLGYAAVVLLTAGVGLGAQFARRRA